ncbi:sigma-70 family RNA polymerase sigma factor [Streptomyces mirabilis]|uniref:RNA polymerase sigma factor n=1 Tax=Streptomyces mirabilis TaxID=68239 RepID=UPI0033B958CA
MSVDDRFFDESLGPEALHDGVSSTPGETSAGQGATPGLFNPEVDGAATPDAEGNALEDLREDFRKYWEEHGPRLLRIAYRYSLNTWDAEDVTQELLEKFWSNWGNAEYRDRVWNRPGFSVTCLINVWRDMARSEISRTRRQDLVSKQVVEKEDDYSCVEGAENFARMMKILEDLNPTWRLVIQLRYVHEKTFTEVAAFLRISEATARRFEKRAHKALEEADKRY